ncbi:MAG TPA: hypothetical protein VLB27_10495 [candidate division Zixibacteria bacterium]|nr:hypothetical protein [candidate division Zixibacteria bacterium]
MTYTAELFFYSMLAGGGYLLVVELALAPIERALDRAGLWDDFPERLRKVRRTISLNDYITQLALFVALPAALYSWMYLMLPLEGARQGVAIALWTVLIGGAPMGFMIGSRARIPAAALVYLLLTHLVKLAGCLAILGYIFSL